MKKNKALRKSDILYHIVKGWKIVLLFTLIGLVSGFVIIGAGYIRGEVSREYRITSSFAVVATKLSESNVEYNDLSAARSMTDTAMYIVNSKKNMEAVVEDIGLRGVSANDISRNLSLTRYNETEVVEMTLLWRSEKEGLSIMESINRVSTSAINDTLKVGSVSVINEPQASFIVGGNISISTWIYAAVIGLLAGIGICILRFLIAPSLINEDDVASLFGITTLGSLPLNKQYARMKPTLDSELPILDDIKSVSHLLISNLESAGVNKLYITSTMNKEGKTRLLADIALQLSRLGKKTLLIDCDLSNPRLGALFFDELKYEQTLNALYRGDSDKIDAIQHVNGCLDILPTVLEKNPESLNDPLLEELKRVMDGYDYVLIDTAPIGVDAEVLRLNEVVDTVLYVVRYDFAKIDDIKRSMLRIARSGIPVVGAVFNCTINWRQTIINAPKRLSSSLRREEKRKKKEEKKRAVYQELRSEREKARKPAVHYLDGIEPSENPREINTAARELSPDIKSENTAAVDKKAEKKRLKMQKAEEKAAVKKRVEEEKAKAKRAAEQAAEEKRLAEQERKKASEIKQAEKPKADLKAKQNDAKKSNQKKSNAKKTPKKKSAKKKKK